MRPSARRARGFWVLTVRAVLCHRSQAERKVHAIIGEYELIEMVQVVTWLAAEGLTTVGLLAAVDHNAFVNLGLCHTDADRVILAAWLHARDFEMYGARLIQRGIVNKLMCASW